MGKKGLGYKKLSTIGVKGSPIVFQYFIYCTSVHSTLVQCTLGVQLPLCSQKQSSCTVKFFSDVI